MAAPAGYSGEFPPDIFNNRFASSFPEPNHTPGFRWALRILPTSGPSGGSSFHQHGAVHNSAGQSNPRND